MLFYLGEKEKCSHKITLIQKRAARIILNKPLFKELKWLTFPDRCNYHSALLVYKTLTDTYCSFVYD